MKYIKLFESMTRKEVKEICYKYGINNWTLRPDGLVDVDGDVDLSYISISKLPLRFGRVTDFSCSYNKLTTLEGAPTEVGGNFDCSFNDLSTLKGAPIEVGGSFICRYNNLTTLEGAPKEVGGRFYCYHNELTTLEGAPKEVGGSFYCYHNELTTLKWAPEYIGGEVDFLPNDNLPTEFLNFLGLNSYRKDLEKYILNWQKDYAVWRRDGSFNEANFIQMMEDAQDELQNIKIIK